MARRGSRYGVAALAEQYDLVPRELLDMGEWGPVRLLPIPTTTASESLTALQCKVVGWSLAETTGAAAAWAELLNGTATSGEQGPSIRLAQGTSQAQGPAAEGPIFDAGLFLVVQSGSVRGCVFVRFRRQPRVEENGQ